MQTEKEQVQQFQAWLLKFIVGGTSGVLNAFAVTPFMNYNNHVIKRKAEQAKAGLNQDYANQAKSQFTIRRAFDGALSYSSSFFIRISISLTLNSYLLHYLERFIPVEKEHKLMVSIVSGGIAGMAATLSEAVAQTQQLSTPKPSASSVIRDAYKYNGAYGLFRGALPMMVRSASLTAGYIVLMPMCRDSLRKKYHPFIADVLSALICGFMISTVATPANKLRYEKQVDFNMPGKLRTYKEIFKQNPGMRFLMAGFMSRCAANVCTMLFITEMNEQCDFYSREGFPDFPSLTFKK